MSLSNVGLYSTYYLNKVNVDPFNRAVILMHREVKKLDRKTKKKKEEKKPRYLTANKSEYRVERLHHDVVGTPDNEDDIDSTNKIVDDYFSARENEKNTAHKLVQTIGAKLFWTDNQKNHMTHNTIAEKRDQQHIKEIDDQLKYNLTQIKRDKNMLLDRYLELEAIKYYYVNKAKPQTPTKPNVRATKSAPGGSLKSHKGKPNEKIMPFDSFNEEQMKLYDKLAEFYGKDYDSLPLRQKIHTPDTFKPYMQTIQDRFREQNDKYYPNYKRKFRKPKISISYEELIEGLASGRKRHRDIRASCSRCKQHELAEHKADTFIMNKHLVNRYPSYTGMLVQSAKEARKHITSASQVVLVKSVDKRAKQEHQQSERHEQTTSAELNLDQIAPIASN